MPPRSPCVLFHLPSPASSDTSGCVCVSRAPLAIPGRCLSAVPPALCAGLGAHGTPSLCDCTRAAALARWAEHLALLLPRRMVSELGPWRRPGSPLQCRPVLEPQLEPQLRANCRPPRWGTGNPGGALVPCPAVPVKPRTGLGWPASAHAPSPDPTHGVPFRAAFLTPASAASLPPLASLFSEET